MTVVILRLNIEYMNMYNNYKFVIVSPRQNCGGAIVLHVLCKLLCDIGYDASIFYCQYCGFETRREIFCKPVWLAGTVIDYSLLFLSKILPKRFLQRKKIFEGYCNVPIKGCTRRLLPWVDNKTIVVYPEIIYGNPIKAKNVVRWLLYYNKIYNSQHPDSYEITDCFYCYRKIFNDYRLNPTAKTLNMSYYNLDLYKRYNYGKRTGRCYVIRKGSNRKDLPKHFDGVIIDDLPEIEKVKQFNQCEYCISYDMQTAYTLIAALCGCISILIPEEGKKRGDYRKPGEIDYGEAFGYNVSEIEYARSTMNKVYESFLRFNTEGKENVQQFANDCICFFESKKS